MRFLQVRPRAPGDRLDRLAEFYGARLGLEKTPCFQIGETALEFEAGSGEPFYHFALLVPGDRFAEAMRWAASVTELLPVDGLPEVAFDRWRARACYFHDPAGNIVELIAHAGIGETGAGGEFRARELLGVSEVGLVGDAVSMARELGQELGIEHWDGTLEDPGGLAFVGERARTLILSPPVRGWMPTGRPAERHELDLKVSAPRAGRVALEGARYRISSVEV
jgi:hypothetical protein